MEAERMSEVTTTQTTSKPRDDWGTDPANPRNWSARRRWTIIIILTLTNFVACMTTLFEPGINDMMQDFHDAADTLNGFVISIYTLGYCVGPLVIAPMSEIYGRIWLLRVAYPVYLIALVICASSTNLTVFIIFRAITGIPGIIFIIIGLAMVPDLMPVEQRGVCVTAIITSTGLGPTIGPVLGGFIVQRTSWRWTMWVVVIAFGICTVFALPILTETYGPVLMAKHNYDLRRTDSDARNRHDKPQQELHIPLKRLSALIQSPWMRPFRMMVRSPMILLFTLYSTTANAFLVFLIATLGLTFQQCYKFSASASGSAYLGMAIGFFVSQVTFGRFSDKWLTRAALRRGGVKSGSEPLASLDGEGQHASSTPFRPEDRLPPFVLGAFVMPLGLLMYGWGTHTHWIVPIVGSAVFAAGFMYVTLPVTAYLVDAYPAFAASAVGAMTVVRQVVGSILPLAAEPLYTKLGFDWGNSVLAFIALGFAPFAVLLVLKGQSIRLRFQAWAEE